MTLTVALFWVPHRLVWIFLMQLISWDFPHTTLKFTQSPVDERSEESDQTSSSWQKCYIVSATWYNVDDQEKKICECTTCQITIGKHRLVLLITNQSWFECHNLSDHFMATIYHLLMATYSITMDAPYHKAKVISNGFHENDSNQIWMQAAWMCIWQICRDYMMQSCQHGPEY